MGYQLYRAILSGAPPDWSSAERLVALVIADDASDKTGRSRISIEGRWRRDGTWEDGVTQKTGLRPDTILMALYRLSKKGYEFRVPIGKGKDGRLVYAAKGHALDFCVPEMPPRLVRGSLPDALKGPTGVPAFEAKGPTGVPAFEAKGPTGVPAPSPQRSSPQKSLSPHQAPEADIILAAVPDATEREIDEVLKTLRTGGVKNLRAYLRRVASNGDLAGLIEGTRNRRQDLRSVDCKVADTHQFCKDPTCRCDCHLKEAP